MQQQFFHKSIAQHQSDKSSTRFFIKRETWEEGESWTVLSLVKGLSSALIFR
jgi:hypothetical protein